MHKAIIVLLHLLNVLLNKLPECSTFLTHSSSKETPEPNSQAFKEFLRAKNTPLKL